MILGYADINGYLISSFLILISRLQGANIVQRTNIAKLLSNSLRFCFPSFNLILVAEQVIDVVETV